MPEFQRKAAKFQSKGMQWNAAVDSIPDGQVCYALNLRATQQGTLTSRPGITDYHLLPGTYGHSISRLNNYDPNVNFSRGYLVGIDNSLNFGAAQFVFNNEVDANIAIKNAFTNAAQNPLKLPAAPLPSPGQPIGSTTALSGNPLTMVDMAPVGSTSGWKYVGDANLNLSVGLYPGDNPQGPSGVMARAITMGIKPPAFMPALAVGPGLLKGDYQWMVAFRNKWTGARSNPSAPSREGPSDPMKTLTDQSVQFYLPSAPLNPQDGLPDTANVKVDVYRFGGTVNDWRYIGTADGGSIFLDNLPDEAVLTAPSPPQIVDPTTGVVRFNKYQPFISQDVARYNSPGHQGTIALSAHGTFLLNIDAGEINKFNLGIVPGSAISINNSIFTIYQVWSPTQLEITEDATGVLNNGQNVPWAIQAGTLIAGSPLAHLWGPYGTGEGGAYIFGCGDPNNAGTLFWCNGNDPDSTDLVNSVIVTSPSEPLRGGCIYDGTPFCWSTERMFRIYPGSVAGQFTVQEIPGSKGIWAEYSLTVQSNGISDQSVSWVGKDGIYDWSTSGGLRTLTDRDMYPFFPHDNQPGLNVAQLFPFLAETVPVGAPFFDAAHMKYHRLTWFMDELFYDFPSQDGNYHALVFDGKQAKGWISVDQYRGGFGTLSGKPMVRCNEIAANNLKLLMGGEILDYTGATDSGNTIACRLVTAADDLSEPRAQKLYGDFMMDADTKSVNVSCTPWLDNFIQSQQLTTLNTASRTQSVGSLGTLGLGTMGRNLGFDLRWSATATVTLFQYSYAYVPKPEFTVLRITDKTDDGYNGAKYVRGLCIECNTNNVSRSGTVIIDGNLAGTFNVTANGQLEIPIAITPIVGSELQIHPNDPDSSWQIFGIRWVWEKWPDLTIIQSNWLDMGTTKPKYIRAFTIPVSGPASPPLGFNAVYDGTTTVTTTTVAPSSIAAKSAAQFSFNPPILAHQLKLVPSTPCRVWYEEIKWDAEEWPENAKLYGPVENLGTSGAKYLRGLELPVETGGVPVQMTILYDKQNASDQGTTLAMAFTNVQTDPLSKNVFPLTPIPPIIAHEFQLRSETPARFWYSEVKWDFEPWPEYDTGRTPWLDNGTPSAKFVRGITMPVDTGGLPVTFELLLDTGQIVTFGPFTTIAGNKTSIYCGFTVPLVVHEFQILPQSDCRIWYGEIKWDADPWPEMEVESSSWGDAGYAGAKFVQGVLIPMDTGGLPVSFVVTYDIGSMIIGPFTTPAGQKTTVAYSFPTPFICHNLLLTPSAACRVWYDEVKWIWEPEPELVTTYTTQATDHDLPGYNYLFDAYIAYIGSADAPHFTVTTEFGSMSYVLPVSNGVYTRAYLLLNPQKSKWKSYSITSTGGIRLFLKDCEVRAKNWTDKGNYPSSFTSHMPFGAESRIVGARI